MLFFCPLDNPAAPIRTTLADQRALLTGWERKRPGLAIDAPSARAATDTLRAYLLDCHRSGRPGYAPTVEIEEREGVPVATLIDNAPSPCATETAAINAMVANAARKKPGPAKPANAGEMRPDTSASVIGEGEGMAPKKSANPDHSTIDDDTLSAPV